MHSFILDTEWHVHFDSIHLTFVSFIQYSSYKYSDFVESCSMKISLMCGKFVLFPLHGPIHNRQVFLPSQILKADVFDNHLYSQRPITNATLHSYRSQS